MLSPPRKSQRKGLMSRFFRYRTFLEEPFFLTVLFDIRRKFLPKWVWIPFRFFGKNILPVQRGWGAGGWQNHPPVVSVIFRVGRFPGLLRTDWAWCSANYHLVRGDWKVHGHPWRNRSFPNTLIHLDTWHSPFICGLKMKPTLHQGVEDVRDTVLHFSYGFLNAWGGQQAAKTRCNVPISLVGTRSVGWSSLRLILFLSIYKPQRLFSFRISSASVLMVALPPVRSLNAKGWETASPITICDRSRSDLPTCCSVFTEATPPENLIRASRSDNLKLSKNMLALIFLFADLEIRLFCQTSLKPRDLIFLVMD